MADFKHAIKVVKEKQTLDGCVCVTLVDPWFGMGVGVLAHGGVVCCSWTPRLLYDKPG